MQPPPVTPRPRRFGALRYRDFTLLWIGLLISNSGTWMQNVAQSWLTYQLTDSTFYLGLLGASFALPMILLSPVGGTIADYVDRLTILKFSQTAMMLCAATLATLSFLRVITIWHIIAISILASTALALDSPTRQALIPDLVPEFELLSAVSLNSVAFNGAALIGPAIAGLILGLAGYDLLFGSALVFYVNAARFLAVLVPLFLIRPRRLPPHRVTARLGLAILEGISYVQDRPSLLLLLALSAAASLFGRSFNMLLPVFARDLLHVGPEGLGLMLASPGAGTLLAGFSLAAVGHYLNHRRLIATALLGFAATVIAFALSRAFPLSLLLLGLSGFTATLFAAVTATILQLETESHLRGRVMSLYTITIIGLGPLGALLSGTLATVIPVSIAIILPAFLIVVILGYATTQPAWQEVR